MAIRVKHKILVQIGLDTDFNRKLFFIEDNTSAEVVSDGYDQQTSGNVSVAATSIETLSFGDLTDVKGFYLEMDAACKVRLNGSDDAIDMILPDGVTEDPKAKLFIESTLTGVTIENESGAAITGFYALWGNPTP